MAAGTVSTTATTIHLATNGQAGTKETVAIKADTGNTVPIFVGRGGTAEVPATTDNPAVTTANGFPLEAGETIVVEMLAGEGVVGIAASGTPGFRTFVVGN